MNSIKLLTKLLFKAYPDDIGDEDCVIEQDESFLSVE